MAKHISFGSYTAEGIKGLARHGGAAGKAAIANASEGQAENWSLSILYSANMTATAFSISLITSRLSRSLSPWLQRESYLFTP